MTDPKKLHPTIKQFQELYLLQLDGNEDFQAQVNFAAIIKGITRDQAEELTLQEVFDIHHRYHFPDPNQLLPKLPRRIKIKGRRFRVYPNFLMLKTGEFTAFEHFRRTEKTSIQELHHIIGLLTREIKWTWRGPRATARKEAADVYLERSEWLQEYAPAMIALQISAFFLMVWRELSDPT